MNIAVIKTGGKQYKVQEGDILDVEKIADAKGGAVVEFKDLLDAKDVKASIVEEIKGPKIRIFKYKNKVRYRRTTGHRQKYTKIKIDKISG